MNEVTADVDGAMLYESARIRGTTQRKIKEMKENIDQSQADNTRDLTAVTDEISRLEDRIPQLNKAVCE